MAEFDPDKFLAETAPKQSGGFDPDKFLAETKPAEPPKEESFGRRATRAALDGVLPAVGAVAAGLAATPESVGLATIPAGALGYAGGKHLSRVLKHYILGDDIGEKDVSGMAKQTAADLGEGAVMEMGGQVVGEGVEVAAPYVSKAASKVGEGAKKVGKALSDYAEKQYAKGMGAGAKQFEDVAAAKAIGRNGLDNKIMGPYTSAEEALAKTVAAKKAAGESMDQVFKVIDDKVGPSVNPLDAAVQVEKELAPTYRTPINKSEVGQLENTIESILARGDSNISLQEAQALKKEIDSVAYPKGKKPIDPSPKQQMAADASSIVRSHIDKAAESGAEAVGSKDLVEQLAEARRSYGVNKQTEKILTRQVGKEGAGVGKKINWTIDPVKFAASVANKVTPNGAITKAIGADKIAGALKSTPEAFGSFSKILQHAEMAGPQQLAAAHALLEQTNPEYRQVLNQVAGIDNKDQSPTKGPEKWANDGIDNIMNSDQSDIDRPTLEKLKASKSGQKLLIEASTAKNKKAMENVLNKIRSSSSSKGDE